MLLSLAIASPAAGQQESDEERYEKGQQHYMARRFSDAEEIFAALKGKSPNARLYYARCAFRLKRFREAYEEMRQTINEARVLATKEARYAATRDAAKEELNEFKKEVAFVVPSLLGRFELKHLRINRRELPKEQVECIKRVAARKKLKP
ncbi:MAG TPA: CDC27 family protein, partial [Polyangiaceae bacterium]|nr:CDC27 family protein [Polyangiaceae bacterium]